MNRTYGYTICYQTLVIGIAGAIHLVTIVLIIAALCSIREVEERFWYLMKNYQTTLSCKALVDDIQWILQCCGKCSYSDWFKIDWDGDSLKGQGRHERYIK